MPSLLDHELNFLMIKTFKSYWRNHATPALVQTGLKATMKLPSQLPLPLSLLRLGMDQSAALTFPAREDVELHETVLLTVPALRITPATVSETAILYFHGGAFFAGSPRSHVGLASEIAVRSHATVFVVDYRRAPEFTYPAALHDGIAAYRGLLNLGYAPQQIMVGGDSAGATHALNLVLNRRDQGDVLPAGIFLLSPFVDLSLSSPSVRSNARIDPMLTAQALRRGVESYRGYLQANDPRISPLFADLTGLPPLLIQAGSNEILHDDSIKLSDHAAQAGVIVHYHIYQGMWHNFQMFAGYIPAARQALNEIAHFVRQYLPRGTLAAV